MAVEVFPLERILQALGGLLASLVAGAWKGWREERAYRKKVRLLMAEADLWAAKRAADPEGEPTVAMPIVGQYAFTGVDLDHPADRVRK
jgi:hypothetical protein